MAAVARMLQLQRISKKLVRCDRSPITHPSSRHSCISAILNRYRFHKREFAAHTNSDKRFCEDVENNEADLLKSIANPDNVPTSINESSTIQFSARSTLKASSRHDLAMIFTCKV